MKKIYTDILDEDIDLEDFPFGGYDENTEDEENWNVPVFDEEDPHSPDTDNRHSGEDNIEDIRMFTDEDLNTDRPSWLFTDVNVAENSRHEMTGFQRKNMLNDSVTNYYDNAHRKIGYSYRSPVIEDLTVYCDAGGKRIGYSRKDMVDDGWVNYYDKKGKYLGRARKSFLYDDLSKFFRKK